MLWAGLGGEPASQLSVVSLAMEGVEGDDASDSNTDRNTDSYRHR